MRSLIGKIQESICSIIEICMLVSTLFLPKILNATGWIELCFKTENINFDNIVYYILLQKGNYFIGLVVFCLVLVEIRKFNKEKLFNTKNVYHDYPYIWYWFCAKILGYKKCNLKLVPIYMQFKLGLRDTFNKYDVGSDNDYPTKDDEIIDVYKKNFDHISNEINLILADTYPLSEDQLPLNKKRLATIIIERDKGNVSRYFSPNFIEKIVNEVRGLPDNVKAINVYATTNPKHTLKIACDVFKMAERGNIERLVVFQQEPNGCRRFSKSGKIIFGRHILG